MRPVCQVSALAQERARLTKSQTPLMKNLNAAKSLLGVLGAAAILVACTSSPQRFGPSGAASVPDILTAKNPASISVRPDLRTSWMEPNVKGALLYVADAGVNDVFVYSWPALHLVGNLSGFKVPQGVCVDAKDNVWIANTARSQMVEFAHGGLKPIATLEDKGEYPVGCAIDGTTGDLAVTNIISRAYGRGSLSIYKAAQGSAKTFSDPNFEKMYFNGYDGDGNIYVDGLDNNWLFAIVKFDGKKFEPLAVSGATLNAPGAVVVKGSKIDVEDQSGSSGYSVMYETTLKGSTLSVVATAEFTDSVDCVGTYIAGEAKHQHAICPDGGTPSIYVYDYPAGGYPTKSILTGLNDPEGAAISR
jgi:hypothetical protein